MALDFGQLLLIIFIIVAVFIPHYAMNGGTMIAPTQRMQRVQYIPFPYEKKESDKLGLHAKKIEY